ncbi:MAG TPA: restriction endonuclease [Thermoanaerobaculia bacterium]|jgi:hypothetical protein|nr:restriction endonuclease [Thermoanaerobaculia bacterium]
MSTEARTTADHGLLDRLFEGRASSDDVRSMAQRFAALAADTVVDYLRQRGEPGKVDEIRGRYYNVGFTAAAKIACAPNLNDRRLLLKDLIITHPELVLPIGFDEVRYGAAEISDPTLSSDAVGLRDEWYDELDRGNVGLQVILTGRTQYRSHDGVWHDYFGVVDRLVPEPQDHVNVESASGTDWWKLMYENWSRQLLSPTSSCSDVTAALLPSLNVPIESKPLIQVASTSILQEIANESVSLAQIHWRVLEEIVAELLRNMGMTVHLTPRSADGGRDVIARGELIPGEPTILAVEVKHRPTVPVSDLRNALWANRHFPALLFVTSGRFSAGVYREQIKGENRLRLLLKDGLGLRQWIDQYASRHAER